MSNGENRRAAEVEHPGGIPRQALEVIADVLLAAAGRDCEYPAYSEFQLKRKCRKLTGAAPDSGNCSSACADVLLEQEIADLVEAAELSNSERHAWEMHLAGYSPAEIARALCVARPTAVGFVHAASRRISTCPSKYRGLHAVYLSQIRRRVYRRPTHTGEDHRAEWQYASWEDALE